MAAASLCCGKGAKVVEEVVVSGGGTEMGTTAVGAGLEVGLEAAGAAGVAGGLSGFAEIAGLLGVTCTSCDFGCVAIGVGALATPELTCGSALVGADLGSTFWVEGGVWATVRGSKGRFAGKELTGAGC